MRYADIVENVRPLPRRLDIARDLRRRSVFLFGPRQTGKTTWLRQNFPDSAFFNLLQGDVFLRLSREPGRFRQELAATSPASGPVVIDEIQKLPRLLDEVHDLIESRGFRFVLAASSPAKLRRGGVNLLGGRARTRRLCPFVSAEVPDWDLERAINVGGIPSIYFSDEPEEDLRAYCGNYLRLEVQAEGLVRGVEPFSRFLTAAGASYAQAIVFERLASDAGVRPARCASTSRWSRTRCSELCSHRSPPGARAANRFPARSCSSSTSGSPTRWRPWAESCPAARCSVRPWSNSSSAS